VGLEVMEGMNLNASICCVSETLVFALTEYISAEGKTKVGMMFASDSGKPFVEITKTVIRVCYKCY